MLDRSAHCDPKLFRGSRSDVGRIQLRFRPGPPPTARRCVRIQKPPFSEGSKEKHPVARKWPRLVSRELADGPDSRQGLPPRVCGTRALLARPRPLRVLPALPRPLLRGHGAGAPRRRAVLPRGAALPRGRAREAPRGLRAHVAAAVGAAQLGGRRGSGIGARRVGATQAMASEQIMGPAWSRNRHRPWDRNRPWHRRRSWARRKFMGPAQVMELAASRGTASGSAIVADHGVAAGHEAGVYCGIASCRGSPQLIGSAQVRAPAQKRLFAASREIGVGHGIFAGHATHVSAGGHGVGDGYLRRSMGPAHVVERARVKRLAQQSHGNGACPWIGAVHGIGACHGVDTCHGLGASTCADPIACWIPWFASIC